MRTAGPFRVRGSCGRAVLLLSLISLHSTAHAQPEISRPSENGAATRVCLGVFVILMSAVPASASLAQVVVNCGFVRAGRVETALRNDRWSRVIYPVVFLAISVWSLAL